MCNINEKCPPKGRHFRINWQGRKGSNPGPTVLETIRQCPKNLVFAMLSGFTFFDLLPIYYQYENEKFLPLYVSNHFLKAPSSTYILLLIRTVGNALEFIMAYTWFLPIPNNCCMSFGVNSFNVWSFILYSAFHFSSIVIDSAKFLQA